MDGHRVSLRVEHAVANRDDPTREVLGLDREDLDGRPNTPNTAKKPATGNVEFVRLMVFI